MVSHHRVLGMRVRGAVCFMLTFALLSPAYLWAGGPIRIIVLPGYVEQGEDLDYDMEIMGHYRRTMRFINNQLVRHGFEVINPSANEIASSQMEALVEPSSAKTQSVCGYLTKKYGTDAAYIIWLDVFARRTADGLCQVRARIDGEGYDSGGRDLGAGLAKDYEIVEENCIVAIEKAEKEIGDLVGRKLTAYQP